MTDQVLRPDGTGFHLAGGELTTPGSGRPVGLSVTAGLFGGVGMDVTIASWNSTHPDNAADVRSDDGATILRLRTQPMMLNSLPSSVRVQLRTADTNGAWRLALHFRNQGGSSLTWHADLPTEAFGAGWLAPLADLLTVDGTPATTPPQSPAVAVVRHPDDEYYELLVDGQRAGILVYHTIGTRLSITHTVIDPTYRGRGLSGELVGRALDDIRTQSVTVSNYCAVVGRFVAKHPAYLDLLQP
jgi:predicted GNAT family acetyltransferase